MEREGGGEIGMGNTCNIKIKEKNKFILKTIKKKKKNPPVSAGYMGSIPDLEKFHMLRGN